MCVYFFGIIFPNPKVIQNTLIIKKKFFIKNTIYLLCFGNWRVARKLQRDLIVEKFCNLFGCYSINQITGKVNQSGIVHEKI